MVMAKTNPTPSVILPPRPLPVPPPVDHFPTPEPGGCKPPMPDAFDAKDGNHDGKLNADEFNEGRGVIEKIADPDKFDRYDSNNDGYVTKTENAIGQFRDAVGSFKKSKHELPGGKKFEPGAELKPAEGPKAEASPDELPALPEFKRAEAKIRPE